MDDLVIRLRTEIKRLLEQNAELGQQNAELVQLVHELSEQNTGLREHFTTAVEQATELRKELATVEQRIEELEQTKKEPPSFIKPNRPKREGPSAPRRQRAQEHNHGRKRAEVITRRVEHTIERCPECDCMLCKKCVAHIREGIDIPPPQEVEVTEHVVYKGYCPRCAGWKYAVAGEAGAVVGQRRFGTRLMAEIGFLTETLRLTNRAIQSYLKTMHGLEISEGAIVDLRRGLAKKLQPVATALKAQVRGSAIVHADAVSYTHLTLPTTERV